MIKPLSNYDIRIGESENNCENEAKVLSVGGTIVSKPGERYFLCFKITFGFPYQSAAVLCDF